MAGLIHTPFPFSQKKSMLRRGGKTTELPPQRVSH
jgi:hypothetical protein